MRVVFISAVILLFTLFENNLLQAQSAVFVCAKTGRWGTAFDDGNTPRMSLEQTKREAKKRCQDTGGEDCQLVFSSTTKGWYTFFLGSEKEKYIFAVGQSLVSEKESMKKAIDNFIQRGGVVRTNCQTSSWYAPKNAIGHKANNPK